MLSVEKDLAKTLRQEIQALDRWPSSLRLGELTPAGKPLTTNAILKQILERALSLTGALRGEVWLVREDSRNRFLVRAEHDENEPAAVRFDLVAAKGAKGALPRKPLPEESLARSVVEAQQALWQDGPVPSLAVPLFEGPCLVAVLQLTAGETGRSLPREALPLLQEALNLSYENALIRLKAEAQLQKINGQTSDLERALEAQRQLVETLQEGERRYRDLFQDIPISLFEMTHQGHLLSANPAAFATFCYEPEDLDKGINAIHLCLPQDQPRLLANTEEMLRGKSTGSFECTLVRKDGTTFPAMIFASPLIRRSVPIGLRGAIIDMSRHRASADGPASGAGDGGSPS